jgi:plasmid stabilization system protein ParE
VSEDRYQVLENTEVLRDYVAIAIYVERWTGDRVLADRTVDTIRGFIRSLAAFPHRGTPRDDLRPGLRVIPFKKRTAIAFEIDEPARCIIILRVFYAGQDYEAIMRDQ